MLDLLVLHSIGIIIFIPSSFRYLSFLKRAIVTTWSRRSIWESIGIIEKSIYNIKETLWNRCRDEVNFLLGEGAIQRKRNDGRAYLGGTDSGNRESDSLIMLVA